MAQFYDVSGREVSQGNLQDRPFWYVHGERKEDSFVARHPNLGYRINPDKNHDPTAIDLIDRAELLADLKTQNTPFFVANRYGVAPQFAVTFNKKDKLRYQSRYPDIDIVFWVEWEVVRADFGTKTCMVEPMRGVWRSTFAALIGLCDDSKNLHTYVQRIGDSGNANDSYVLDLQNPIFVQIA